MSTKGGIGKVSYQHLASVVMQSVVCRGIVGADGFWSSVAVAVSVCECVVRCAPGGAGGGRSSLANNIGVQS